MLDTLLFPLAEGRVDRIEGRETFNDRSLLLSERGFSNDIIQGLMS